MSFKTYNVSKQNANIEYTGSWTGLSVGTEVQIEDAQNVTGGVGYFGVYSGNYGLTFANEIGGSAVNLIEGTDYNYDEYLDSDTGGTDLYDTGTSGALASGKVFRIVENGKNITDDTGLDLRIVAKDLTQNVNPPITECYVDPDKGQFILPGPIYFNKMESWNNCNTPNIGFGSYQIISGVPSLTSVTGKFNNGLEAFSSSLSHVVQINATLNNELENGTISYYVNRGSNSVSYIRCILQDSSLSNIIEFRYDGFKKLAINNTEELSGTSAGTSDNVWYHLYAIWDKNSGLAGSKSFRIFIDGVEDTSMDSGTLLNNNIAFFKILMSSASSSTSARPRIDNLKIWDHVVSEDPSWIYNSGTGREDAIHSIYDSGNNYSPVLDSSSTPDSGVGYIYIPPSDSPAILDETSATGASVKWTI